MENGKTSVRDKSTDLMVVVDHTATSITDSVQVAKRKDNSILLRLLSVTPDYLVENHRTVICKDEIIILIDGLCNMLKYYPIKPLPKKKLVKRKIK